MQDILTMLHALHRPRLMMRAARIGAEDYRRAAHLPRLLGYRKLPGPSNACMQLMAIEGDWEEKRITDDASYNMVRHLDVLIALVAEARILRVAQASALHSTPGTPLPTP